MHVLLYPPLRKSDTFLMTQAGHVHYKKFGHAEVQNMGHADREREAVSL